jgi:hypothetical protein
MKNKLIVAMVMIAVLALSGTSYAQRSIGMLLEEADGSPAGFAVKMIVPNTSLALTSGVATLTVGGTGTITQVGDGTTTGVFTADGEGNTLYFEGTTADGVETILVGRDATGSDGTLYIPNLAGTTADLVISGVSNFVTDNVLIRADGTTLPKVQKSGVALDDSDNMSGVGTLATTGLATFNAGIDVKYGATASGFINIYEDSSDGTDAVKIQVPAIAAGYTLTLPTTDGTASQVLTTDGSGVLSWTSPTAGAGDVTAAAAIDTTAVVVGDDGAKGVKKTGVLIDGSDNISGGASLALGTNPADAGTIRLPNTGTIIFEDTEGTGEVTAMTVSATEVLTIGDANTTSVTITPATTFTGGITDAGTIVAGTWNGTAIAAAYIGTDLTAANLGATLTFADGDLIDFSGITHSSTTPEGLKLPAWGNFNPSAGVGYIAWDTASSSIKIYDSGWKAFAAAAAPIDSPYMLIGANDSTLTADRYLVAGAGLSEVDGGANSTYTLAVDTAEITGARTWAAGGAASIAWTWDNSGTLDPSLTFGDGLITSNSSVTIATGKNLTIGTTQLNLSDTIDASKITITSQAQGDTLYASSGTAWARLAKDATATRYLSNTGTNNNPAWAQVNLANGVTGTLPVGNGGTGLTSGTSGGVPYYSASDAITSSAALAQYQIVMGGGAGAAPATLGSAGTAGQLLMSGGAAANPAFAGTLTGSYVLGDADTDTVTIRSRIIGGNSRQVNIDDDDTSAPTYATATNALYVEGDVEAGGTVYASKFIGGTGTNEQRGTWFTSNTSMTACYSSDGVFFLNDVATLCENGTQRDIVTPADSVTWTGTSHSFAGVTNLRLPTASADSSGEISINPTGHQLLLHAGGSSADNALQTFDFDTCSAGYILKTDGSGNWTCGADATAGSPTLDTVGDPVGDSTIVFAAGEEVVWQYTGAFTTGSQFQILQDTGNPSGGVLFEVLVTDTDVTAARIGDGTNYTQFGANGALAFAGTATFSAGGATTSIPMVVGTATASGITGAGQMYFESDTEILTLGDGATSITLDFTPNTVITFPTTTATLARTDAGQTFTGVQAFTAPTVETSITPNTFANASLGTGLLPFSSVFIGDAATNNVQLINTAAASAVVLTLPSTTGTLALIDSQVFTTYIESPYIILGSAATAADAGQVRLANTATIAWELAATGTDVTLGVNATDDMVAALVAATDLFQITTGNLKIGAGTQTQTLDGADAYITGFLEVDGMIYADGGVTGALTGTASGNIANTLADAAGDLIQGSADNTWARLAKGAEGTILRAGASLNAYSTSTFADTYVQGGLLHAATANTIAALAPGAVGSFLMSNGASAALSYLAAGAANYQLVGAGVTTIPVWTASTGTGAPVLGTSPVFTTSILPSAAGATVIGTTALPFSSIFIGDAATNNIQLINTDASSAKVATLPDVTGTVLVAATSTTTTQAMFATATAGAPAFRAIADADIPKTLTGMTITATGAITTAAATGVHVGTTGVALTSDDDGAITFTGESAGDDQTLTINLDDTVGSVVVTSSEAAISFSALNIVTTGTISGKIPVVVNSGTTEYAVTQAQVQAGTFFITTVAGATTYTLPGAEAGAWVCFKMGQGNAQTLTLDTDGTDYIVMTTGARTSAAGDYYAATSSASNQICVVAFDATDWYATSAVGTWAEQ